MVAAWIELEVIIWSGINQEQKANTTCLHLNVQAKKDTTVVGSRIVVIRGWEK
jgi:hypothetical protein